jgi:hypothetical protein
MPMWFWLVIGGAALFALSVLAGVLLAAILEGVSREMTELLELEPRALAPPARTKARLVKV